LILLVNQKSKLISVNEKLDSLAERFALLQNHLQKQVAFAPAVYA